MLERYHPDWAFVSDDQPAIDFARRSGLTAIDSEAVLAGCYNNGLVGCPEAFDLLNSMADAGRGVRPAESLVRVPAKARTRNPDAPPEVRCCSRGARSLVILSWRSGGDSSEDWSGPPAGPSTVGAGCACRISRHPTRPGNHARRQGNYPQ